MADVLVAPLSCGLEESVCVIADGEGVADARRTGLGSVPAEGLADFPGERVDGGWRGGRWEGDLRRETEEGAVERETWCVVC